MNRPKIAMISAGVFAVLALATMAGAWAAEPLGPGSYELVFGGSTATLTIDAYGVPQVTSDDDVVVVLQRDALGRVLDEMVVDTPTGAVGVEIVTQANGVYQQIDNGQRPQRSGRTPEQDVAASRQTPVVTVVEACAPDGLEGWPAHGTVLSAAANGLPVTVQRSDAAQGSTVEVTFDLSSLSGAYALCAEVRSGGTTTTSTDGTDASPAGGQ